MVAVLSEEQEPQYILRELGWARELGLPTLAVAEPEVSLPPVYAVAGGERRRAPFMLREEIKLYGGALDPLGKVHDLIAPDRRRVINAELRRGP
jgi:hypothetical protein